MGYFEYIGIIRSYLEQIESPKILEIGIEAGTITIPMLKHLISLKKDFYYHGVDICIKDNIKVFKSKIFRRKQNTDKYIVNFIENNSLNELPKLINDKNLIFDLILIDGDHNYYTVSKELNYIKSLSKKGTMVIMDDYYSPWDTHDFWYSEAFPQNTLATGKTPTIQQGVLPAIQEWITENKLDLYTLTSSKNLIKNNDNLSLPVEESPLCHAVLTFIK